MRGDPLLLKLLLDAGDLGDGIVKNPEGRVDFDGQVQWRKTGPEDFWEFSLKNAFHLLLVGGSNIFDYFCIFTYFYPIPGIS